MYGCNKTLQNTTIFMYRHIFDHYRSTIEAFIASYPTDHHAYQYFVDKIDGIEGYELKVSSYGISLSVWLHCLFSYFYTVGQIDAAELADITGIKICEALKILEVIGNETIDVLEFVRS